MIKLPSTTITGSSKGPHLLITAGIHGDEFEGIFAIYHLLRQIDVANLCGTLTLVPVANQSAVDRHSRCGEDGKDLARTFPGDLEGSPTEQIAATLNDVIANADLYIDLHSGGRTMDVYPLCGYGLVDNPATLDTQRQMARAMGLPLVWGTSAALNGRSMSAARDAGVPAIYAEYRGRGSCDPQGVQAYVDGCLAVMARFDMLGNAGKSRQHPHPLIVEDPRPDSGHMQVCNPSPFAGLFEPAVELGQFVHGGETLGMLIDPLSGREQQIVSAQTGPIIVLRSYPQVDEGDALAVILDNDDNTSPPIHLPPC